MNQQDKAVVHVKLIVKSSNTSRKIECIFDFMDKSKSFKMKHEFEEEFDFDIFWDELGRVWKDRDKLFSKMQYLMFPR